MALNTYYPTYNNPYQQTYNPYMPQQPQMVQSIQAPQPQQTAQPSINWVSGDREAAAYPVAPNSAVALWSQTEPVVYLKQSDATGKPTMKIYDLVERQAAPAAAQTEKAYATRDDLEHVREEIERIKEEMSKKKARRREEDEE